MGNCVKIRYFTRSWLPQLVMVFCTLLTLPFASADLIINECLSSNQTGITDEEGDSSDWFELYNRGETPVSLGGLALSDNPSQPHKWLLPDFQFQPGAFLQIYASGKDRRAIPKRWHTVVDWGDEWRYRPNIDQPPPDWWHTADFDDSNWAVGSSGIGYGYDTVTTTIPRCISLSARINFEVADPREVEQICLHLDYDDGFIAWINGVEIARVSLGTDQIPYWYQPAAIHTARLHKGLSPETFIAEQNSSILRQGTNTLTIEVHNSFLDSANMLLIPILTLGLGESAPDGEDEINELIRYCLPHLHTNFKLSAAGETLGLTSPSGELIDQISIGPLPPDISRGRSGEGDSWTLFDQPTPGGPNPDTGFHELTDPPEFFPVGGLFPPSSGPEEPALTIYLGSSAGAEIFYTLDGNDPEQSDRLYTEPIQIHSTTAIKARCFKPGNIPSPVITHTYVVDRPSSLPILSLTIEPADLWDENSGIYVPGPEPGDQFPFLGANYWRDWERPAHMEFFSRQGQMLHRQSIDLKIHGGFSRVLPQKSLRLIARKRYGADSINYRFFDDKDIESFTQLVLRNAGQDFDHAHLRDALQNHLAAGLDLDRVSALPTILYLNGDYWGVMNLRERVNADYLAANRSVDSEAVDLLRDEGVVATGDSDNYNSLLDYLSTSDMTADTTMNEVDRRIDIDNFITTFIFRTYFANGDWPRNNERYWRPRTSDGRWRWILYDMDFALGYPYSIRYNALSAAALPLSGYSSYILVKLLENDQFRWRFISAYADHLNTTFVPTNIIPIARDFIEPYREEMPRHVTRWEQSIEEWEASIALIEQFLNQRPLITEEQICDLFDLPGSCSIQFRNEPVLGGAIELTAVTVDSIWQGSYFKTVPMTITAIPAPGYIFAGWSDQSLPQTESITIIPNQTWQIAAIYEHASPAPDQVIISEINYRSAPDHDSGDWVEITNRGDRPINLYGWIFEDSDPAHRFGFPAGTVISPGEYLILAEDHEAFANLFPDLILSLPPLDFGFSSNGEVLSVRDEKGLCHHSVQYATAPPWPTKPNGGGASLELIDPLLDNAIAKSWSASVLHGTPGKRRLVQAGDLPSHIIGPANGLLKLGAEMPPLRYALDQVADITLAIYDIEGRQVSLLDRGRRLPGIHEVSWSGVDGRQYPLSCGLYFIRLTGEGIDTIRRFVVVR